MPDPKYGLRRMSVRIARGHKMPVIRFTEEGVCPASQQRPFEASLYYRLHESTLFQLTDELRESRPHPWSTIAAPKDTEPRCVASSIVQS
jgi:hypothetical protein